METKPCPSCGKLMIRCYANYILCTYPPQHPYDWWCGCGHSEAGGVERCELPKNTLMRQWEAANAP